MSRRKRCPRCAEEVRAEATRCRFCQYEFDGDTEGVVVNNWVRSHPGVITSVAMFLYVAFQIHKAGDFEVVTTVELLHSASLPTILAGVLLVQLPLELLIVAIAASWWLFAAGTMVDEASTQPRRHMLTDPRTFPQTVLACVVLMSFYTSPWPFFALAFSVGLAATVLARRRKPYGRRLSMWAPRALATSIALLFLIMVGRPTTWVPAEAVTTAGGETIAGYVVSADGDWTTVLTPKWTNRLEPGQNSLRRVPTKDVVARETCRFSFSDNENFADMTRLRTLQLITVVFGGPHPVGLTPPCP